MTQPLLMLGITILCWSSGISWLVDGRIAAAIAFFGFGIGYAALAVLFRS